jgi:hypothetical protein
MLRKQNNSKNVLTVPKRHIFPDHNSNMPEFLLSNIEYLGELLEMYNLLTNCYLIIIMYIHTIHMTPRF